MVHLLSRITAFVNKLATEKFTRMSVTIRKQKQYCAAEVSQFVNILPIEKFIKTYVTIRKQK